MSTHTFHFYYDHRNRHQPRELGSFESVINVDDIKLGVIKKSELTKIYGIVDFCDNSRVIEYIVNSYDGFDTSECRVMIVQ